jgi:hypothetical protein
MSVGIGTTTPMGRFTPLRAPLTNLAVSALLAGIVTAVPLLFSRRFYYLDDTQNQGLSSMYFVGRLIREGRLADVVSALGSGGNLSVDPQYGLFFPPKLAMSVFTSLFDNVSLAAVLLAAVFNTVLCLGMVLLLRREGVGLLFSLAGAASVTTSGFIHLWGTNWEPALWAYSLLPWLWLGLRAADSWVRILGVACVCWLITGFAFPSTTVAAAALLLSWAVAHLFIQRRPVGELVPAALAALGGALVGFLNYLPLVERMGWTVRQSGMSNDGFLVPNLTDLVTSSSPVAHDSIFFWAGNISQGPILYIGWFVTPLLLLVDWRAVELRKGLLPTALVYLGVSVLLTQLPSELGPLRFPFRFIPAATIAVTVLVVVAVHEGGVRLTRARVMLVYASVVLALFLSWARAPTHPRNFLLWALTAGILLTALLYAGRKGWRRGLAGVCLTGVLVAQLGLLFGLLPRGQNPDVGDWGAPSRISALPEPVVPANTPALLLRAGSTPAQGPMEQAEGVGVGYLPTYHDRLLGQSYSSVSQKYLTKALCNDHLGASCPAAADFLLSREKHTGKRWIDLMGYEYLLLSKDFAPLERQLGPDWVLVNQGRVFATYKKVSNLPDADVTYRDPAVQITPVSQEGNNLRFQVHAPDGGLVALRELAWPGWTAELNGRPIPVPFLSNILVGLRLPAGSSGTLTVEYHAMETGHVVLLFAVAASSLAGAVAWVLLQRRRARRWDPSEIEPAASSVSPRPRVLLGGSKSTRGASSG